MEASEVIACCRSLSLYSEEPGFTTRTFLSPPMRDIHAALTARMARTGMRAYVDAAGNLRGIYPAGASAAPRLFIGSHLDTVRHAGAFDGVLGVVLAIALVEQLGSASFPLTIEVIGFSDEEGVRFGVPFIGSRAFAGSLDEPLLARRDSTGVSVREAIRAYGLNPDRLADAQPGNDAIGYLEFHIEQGPVLDDLGLPLAVVQSIAGQTRLELTFTGVPGHAGTTPMRARQDALAGAAEWIAAVERETVAHEGLVATVGRLDVAPGASNVIAGWCRASLDVRHADDGVRAAAVGRLIALAHEIAGRRRLTAACEPQLDQPAVAMDSTLRAMLDRAIERSGFPVHRMPSGAGHDAMIVAGRMPAAMLFLRTPGGVSHHPDESVHEADVAAALVAGRAFLDEVAGASRG